MKKIFSIILSIAICLSTPCIAYAQNDKPIEYKARSVVLMCTDNKQVIYEDNSKEHLSPASVTKLMSILLVVEALENGKIKLSDKVSASKNAVAMGGSQIWLEQGEIMTVDELLKAVIIASANDACTALAEYVSGSTASFVRTMNDKARELGLNNTNFENCTGLDDDVKNHYSCAYDLAVISSELIQYDLVKKYTTIWLDSLRQGKTELNNTNKLINRYNGITGLKTGTTSNAGFCVSATASRDGMNFVAVVLGSDTSEQRFDSASNLLDYGFANYTCVNPKIDNKQIKEIYVKQGNIKNITPVVKDVKPILLDKADVNLEYEYKQKRTITAPVKEGLCVGYVIVKSNGKEISRIELVANNTVAKIRFKDIFVELIKNI